MTRKGKGFGREGLRHSCSLGFRRALFRLLLLPCFRSTRCRLRFCLLHARKTQRYRFPVAHGGFRHQICRGLWIRVCLQHIVHCFFHHIRRRRTTSSHRRFSSHITTQVSNSIPNSIFSPSPSSRTHAPLSLLDQLSGKFSII